MNFLQSLSKTTIAFAVLTIGTLLIIYSNPPHTVCTSQKEVFIQSQRGTLYQVNLGKKGNKPGTYDQSLELCAKGNSPGACFEWFAAVKKLLQELNSLQQICKVEMGEIPQVKRALSDSAEMLVKLAWGSAPPTGYADKYGWLELGDVAMFCELKKYYIEAYGQELWDKKRISIYNKLPGVFKDGQALLSSDELWQKTLYSVDCDRVL